jgi:hypothetical protein
MPESEIAKVRRKIWDGQRANWPATWLEGSYKLWKSREWGHLKGYYYPHDIVAQIPVGEFVGGASGRTISLMRK